MPLEQWMYAWRVRLLTLFCRDRVDCELDDELRHHVTLETEARRAQGVPPAEARRQALVSLGGLESARIHVREARFGATLEHVVQDVRFAVRRLAGQRGFTLAALLTLALGIGANTAMFSIVYGLLLRPLPYPDAEGLVRVWESMGGSGGQMLSNRSMPVLEDAGSFEQLAAYRESSVEWASPEGTITLRGAAVSPALFPLLRAVPQLGRLFTDGEAREGADRVVLLSHRAWTNHFASDPDIVGMPLDLNGDPHTIVGVLGEGFYFPNPAGEFWTPLVVPPFTPPTFGGSGQQTRMVVMVAFNALGRLAPGVSAEQAAVEARTLLQSSAGAMFGLPAGETRRAGRGLEVDARIVPLLEEMVGEYRPALLALTVATGLVLLIACINVAGLLLAQGVTRQRALAVYAALGASRWRLVRQLLTENVMLGVGGGVLGLATAAMVLRTVPALVPGDIARLDEVGIDGVTLAFTLGLSIAAGLLFSAVPALQWSRVDLARTLNEGNAQSTGGFGRLRSNRALAVLAVAQVALALVLLVGAGLLLRSFVRLITVDRGYDPANVITARIRNPDATFRPGMTPESMVELRAAARRFQESLVEETARLEVLPAVEAIGVSSRLPLASTGGSTTVLRVAGAPPPTEPRDLPQAPVNIVSPGYFDAMRLRIRSGRAFTRLDGAESPAVLVVNETLARELFGGEPAVGQRLLLAGASPEPWEVVGVVDDVRYGGLTVTDSQAEAYMSLHQMERAAMLAGMLSAPVVTVRTAGDPVAAVPFLREAVAAVSPSANIDDVMTMDARLSAAVSQPRFYAVFVGFFAVLALLLAAFGIYALLSYTVSQRRREIGVRMALGAQRGDVLALVVRQGAGLVAAGIVVGLLASAGTVRLLESFLFGVTGDDRLTLVGAPLVLAGVALVACWLPGHRAARVNPMDALRVE